MNYVLVGSHTDIIRRPKNFSHFVTIGNYSRYAEITQLYGEVASAVIFRSQKDVRRLQYHKKRFPIC